MIKIKLSKPTANDEFALKSELDLLNSKILNTEANSMQFVTHVTIPIGSSIANIEVTDKDDFTDYIYKFYYSIGERETGGSTLYLYAATYDEDGGYESISGDANILYVDGTSGRSVAGTGISTPELYYDGGLLYGYTGETTIIPSQNTSNRMRAISLIGRENGRLTYSNIEFFTTGTGVRRITFSLGSAVTTSVSDITVYKMKLK